MLCLPKSLRTLRAIGAPLIAGVLLITSCESATSQSGTQYISYQTNAVCAACEKTIEGSLGKVKGVGSADLDLADKVVTIQYNPAQVDSATLRKTIEAAGYEAKPVTKAK